MEQQEPVWHSIWVSGPMTEQQFIAEVKDCYKRIFNDMLQHMINDDYLNNLPLRYHEEENTWVEYLGNRLEDSDKRASEIMARIINAVCDKHHIVFLRRLRSSR